MCTLPLAAVVSAGPGDDGASGDVEVVAAVVGHPVGSLIAENPVTVGVSVVAAIAVSTCGAFAAPVPTVFASLADAAAGCEPTSRHLFLLLVDACGTSVPMVAVAAVVAAASVELVASDLSCRDNFYVSVLHKNRKKKERC